MKKQIVVVLILALLVYGCAANAISNRPTPLPAWGKNQTRNELDYGQMTNEELRTIIDKATEELNNRKNKGADEYITTEDGWIISDREGVKLTVISDFNIVRSFNIPYLEFEIIIENQSDNEIQVSISNMSINGWQVSGDIVWDEPVKPGLKRKQKNGLNIDDANVSRVEDIDVVKFSFVVKNYNTGEILYETQTFSLT